MIPHRMSTKEDLLEAIADEFGFDVCPFDDDYPERYRLYDPDKGILHIASFEIMHDNQGCYAYFEFLDSYYSWMKDHFFTFTGRDQPTLGVDQGD